MDTQEKKKRTYKVVVPAPAPIPVVEPASDPPKKKRIAKVAPVVEQVPIVVDVPVVDVALVEEPKKKRSYKVKKAIEQAAEPLPEPVVVVEPVVIEPVVIEPVVIEEPKKKRSYKVRTDVAPQPIVVEPVVIPVVEEPKKKRNYKVRAEAVAPVTAPAPAPAPVKKERKKRVVKTVAPPSHVAEQPPVKPKAIESSEPALLINDEDVITINVRKFEHNGKSYFLNSAKDKLYTIGTDGQPFHYHGRYNRDSETIDTEFADSDAEY
jgi:hypothetical protein